MEQTIKHYFVVCFSFLRENMLFIDIAVKTSVVHNNAPYHTIISKLLIVQSHTIILFSLQKTTHNWNLIYEIFNSCILFNCFTEQLVFLRKGREVSEDIEEAYLNPRVYGLFYMSHWLLKFATRFLYLLQNIVMISVFLLDYVPTAGTWYSHE